MSLYTRLATLLNPSEKITEDEQLHRTERRFAIGTTIYILMVVGSVVLIVRDIKQYND